MLHDIKLEGTLHTFGDKSAGALPLQIWAIDNEEGAPPRHSHDFCELVYIRKGSAMHCHGRKRYPIHAGDCFFIAPHDIEGFDQRNNLCLTNVMFYPRILDPMLRDLKDTPGFGAFFGVEPLFRHENLFRYKLHLSATQQREIKFLLARLEKELAEEAPGYRVAATSLLYELIVFVCRCYSHVTAQESVRLEFSGQEKAVAAAISYLEENYAKSINMQEVAAAAHFSPAALSQKFKQATGTTLIDYMTRFRIDTACALLREGVLSVKEIAYQVGFHDPAYFTRAFTKIMSVSPREYCLRKKQ